ncbi:hypothetical protein EYE40_15215 [Glaciihabitans arcticus]|uniref:Uncharacterized protein n=1 Tax=Glaciihabitans arcticus TaxID=2668039 RepID=A0A4V2JEK0_9MICO|nr:hypothetical protein [Glaciihabitans arcticus]TBN55546.1 hypothetical protein EYE40_15215 [Glaciihabitans arcticus]
MNAHRLDATALEYSQLLSVWREWLPQLRYFTLYLATPGEADRDRFRVSLRYNDERDATGILGMLGIASRPGHLRFDLDSNLEGLLPNSQGWGVIAGRRVYVEVGTTIDIAVWQGLPAFALIPEDFETALRVEALLDRLHLGDAVLSDPSWAASRMAVTRERYPEAFTA